MAQGVSAVPIGFESQPGHRWERRQPNSCPSLSQDSRAILRHIKVEEIAEAIAGPTRPFPPLVHCIGGGRTNQAEQLDSTATKLGRLAGRALAELKKRAKEP
jgi:hypothetical protein